MRGEPMKPATKIGRMVVDVERRSHLLDASGAQHHDAVGQGHGLDLIVSDVDHGAADLPVKGGKLLARGDAQLRIQVRQRLVEQEDLGSRTIARPMATRWR